MEINRLQGDPPQNENNLLYTVEDTLLANHILLIKPLNNNNKPNYILATNTTEPTTFKQAITYNDKKHWFKAC